MKNENTIAIETMEFLMSADCPALEAASEAELEAMLSEVDDFDIPDEEDMEVAAGILPELDTDLVHGWTPGINLRGEQYFYKAFGVLMDVVIDDEEVQIQVGGRDILMSVSYFCEHAFIEYPELAVLIADTFTMLYKQAWI